MWVISSSTYSSERILLEHNTWSSTGTYQLTTMNNTSFKFNFVGDDNPLTYNVSWTDGNWHLITATFDDANNLATIYFDGAFATSGTVTTYTGSRGGTSLFFNGDIDETKIYNRAITAQEVSDIYSGLSDNAFSTLTVGAATLPFQAVL